MLVFGSHGGNRLDRKSLKKKWINIRKRRIWNILTRGNNKLINLLRRVNVEFTDIFKSPELLAENDLTEYINL